MLERYLKLLNNALQSLTSLHGVNATATDYFQAVGYEILVIALSLAYLVFFAILIIVPVCMIHLFLNRLDRYALMTDFCYEIGCFRMDVYSMKNHPSSSEQWILQNRIEAFCRKYNLDPSKFKSYAEKIESADSHRALSSSFYSLTDVWGPFCKNFRFNNLPEEFYPELERIKIKNRTLRGVVTEHYFVNCGVIVLFVILIIPLVLLFIR